MTRHAVRYIGVEVLEVVLLTHGKHFAPVSIVQRQKSHVRSGRGENEGVICRVCAVAFHVVFYCAPVPVGYNGVADIR